MPKPKVIPFENDKDVEITEFKTDPKGKAKKVIKRGEWLDDPKKLRQEADKYKD